MDDHHDMSRASDQQQERPGRLRRLLRWWRQDTIQGIALAVVLLLNVGSWQVVLFTLIVFDL